MSRGTITAVNRSILRPILFCGAEKKSTIIYGMISLAIIAASNFQSPGIYAGPFLFIIAHVFFVFIAKKDPQMVAVYRRHIRYHQGYFPARGGVLTDPRLIRKIPSVYAKRG